MALKNRKDLLWVEVSEKSVRLRDGAKMPDPTESSYLFFAFSEKSYTRAEFARWSGVTFPAPGIYGVECKLSVVKRYRKVEESEFVAAKHTKTTLQEVK